MQRAKHGTAAMNSDVEMKNAIIACVQRGGDIEVDADAYIGVRVFPCPMHYVAIGTLNILGGQSYLLSRHSLPQEGRDAVAARLRAMSAMFEVTINAAPLPTKQKNKARLNQRALF